MTRRHLHAVGSLLGLLALGAASRAAALQPCPAERNCAEVAVEAPSRSAEPGDTVLIRVVFQQGSDDQQAGGVDDVAALTATVGVPGLELADCSPPGADGLNPSFVLLPGEAGRYRVFVQNLTCAGRASCLCPTGEEPRDQYVNLLLVGTPGAAGVPALPNGELLGVAVRVQPDAGPRVPLHIYSALDDAAALPRPPGSAALSVADTRAVDRTVDAGSETMNVRVTDGELTIATAPIATNTPGATATVTEPPTAAATATATATATSTATASLTPVPPTASATATATTAGPVCIGDCDHSHEITVNELIAGVGIVLGSVPASTCPAFECAAGEVDISCLIAGVNAALNGCPPP